MYITFILSTDRSEQIPICTSRSVRRCKTESVSRIYVGGGILFCRYLAVGVETPLSARFSIQRALFRFSHATAGWPVWLSATTPSRFLIDPYPISVPVPAVLCDHESCPETLYDHEHDPYPISDLRSRIKNDLFQRYASGIFESLCNVSPFLISAVAPQSNAAITSVPFDLTGALTGFLI